MKSLLLPPLAPRGPLLDDGKSYAINAVHEDADGIAQRVGLAAALADDLLRVLVVHTAVVGERAERDQSLCLGSA